MAGYRKNKMDLNTKALLEVQRAEEANEAAERNAANIEYIAMMCDVDIPTEAESTEAEEV